MDNDKVLEYLAELREEYRVQRLRRDFAGTEKVRYLIWALNEQVSYIPQIEPFTKGCAIARCGHCHKTLYYCKATDAVREEMRRCDKCGKLINWEGLSNADGWET